MGPDSEIRNRPSTEIRSRQTNISVFYVKISIIYGQCTEIAALSFHRIRVILEKVNDTQRWTETIYIVI